MNRSSLSTGRNKECKLESGMDVNGYNTFLIKWHKHVHSFQISQTGYALLQYKAKNERNNSMKTDCYLQ